MNSPLLWKWWLLLAKCIEPRTPFGVTTELLDRGANQTGSRSLFIKKGKGVVTIFTEDYLSPEWPPFSVTLTVNALKTRGASSRYYVSLLSNKLGKCPIEVAEAIQEFYLS